MRANNQKPYTPKEGKMISDINKAWERLEKSEHERYFGDNSSKISRSFVFIFKFKKFKLRILIAYYILYDNIFTQVIR